MIPDPIDTKVCILDHSDTISRNTGESDLDFVTRAIGAVTSTGADILQTKLTTKVQTWRVSGEHDADFTARHLTACKRDVGL